MRAFLLLLLSVAVFVAAYFAMGWLLPDPETGVSRGGAAPSVPALPRNSDRVIGDIDGVTLRTHDPKTGLAIAEIRIGEYRRVSENEVLLSDVEATILLGGDSGSDGGIITLSSPTGTVDVEGAAEQEDEITAEMLGTADVARLRDVTVRWFASSADAARGAEAAQLVLRVDNLVYDNKRFSVATADTTIDGATVLGDDVPVTVRGRDYDFDGRGLLIRWDQRTRRPTLLRVAHGERLAIKTDQPFLPTRIVSARPRPIGGAMLASAEAGAVRELLAEPPIAPATAPVATAPYKATLAQDVRVEQGGITKLEADAAEVLFSLTSLAAEDAAAEKAPATQPSPPHEPATQPAKEAKEPFQPVTVRWEGELRIEAQDAAALGPALLGPEDARVLLTGSPLVLRERDAEARCAQLRFHRAADELELTGENTEGVTLVDAKRNTLVTSRLVARPEARTATAAAGGYAELRTGGAPDDAAARVAADGGELLRLRWSRQCDFLFERDEEGRSALRQVLARGDVTVRHPDLELDADALDVELAALDAGESGEPARDAQLRAILATGGVRCRLVREDDGEGDEAGGPLRFASDRLRLDLPQGQDGPVTAVAQGNVQSEQKGQRLLAQRMEATLRPDAQGDLALVTMTATGQVRGSGDGGRSFESAVMRVEPLAAAAPAQEDGRDPPLRVRLEGTADQPAVVREGTDALHAPAIEFETESEAYRVPGPGELRATQAREGESPVNVRVSWAGSMAGNAKTIALEGEVSLHAEQPAAETGATLDLRSAEAELDLASRPTAATTRASTPAPAEPKPADGQGADIEARAALAGDIEKLTLRGGVSATAEERSGEALLRSFDLRTEALEAWPTGKIARVEIDTPGRVLFRDLRPQPPAPATRPGVSSQAGSDDPNGFRGAAAVAWERRLSFDPETGLLTLIGGVTLGIEPAPPDDAVQNQGTSPKAAAGRPFRLLSERLLVQTRRTDEGRLEYTQATAEGGARFSTDDVSFEASRISYDPATRMVRAVGTPGAPVTVYDAAGVPTGRFAELVYNVASGQIDRLRDLGAGG